MKRKGIVLLTTIVAGLAILAPALAGCGSDTSSNVAPTDAKGKEAVALVSVAAKRLAVITRQTTAGNIAAATKGWNKLRSIYPPSDDTYMVMLCSDYRAYAYAVRDYIAGTGTLQTAQDARAKVEGDLLAMQ